MKETEIQKEKSRRTVRGELALMVAVAEMPAPECSISTTPRLLMATASMSASSPRTVRRDFPLCFAHFITINRYCLSNYKNY